MSAPKTEGTYCAMFVVDEKPHCVWDRDLQASNAKFMTDVDPTYFEYLATINVQALQVTGQRQHAAVSLRTAYSHGLETLFAFVFAAIQAPDCIFAWLPLYQPRDLHSLVQKVSSNQAIHSHLNIDPMSWQTISDTFLHFAHQSIEVNSSVERNFGMALEWFAKDMLDEMSTKEYNSIKHGMRLRQGGFGISIGAEVAPGVPPTPEQMLTFAPGEFGSTFDVPEKIGGKKSLDYYLIRHSRHWTPERHASRLRIISSFLQNIISFLKVVNGADVQTVQFLSPPDELFDETERSFSGLGELTRTLRITDTGFASTTRQEILGTYVPLTNSRRPT
jgi:hypothetical protein